MPCNLIMESAVSVRDPWHKEVPWKQAFWIPVSFASVVHFRLAYVIILCVWAYEISSFSPRPLKQGWWNRYPLRILYISGKTFIFTIWSIKSAVSVRNLWYRDSGNRDDEPVSFVQFVHLHVKRHFFSKYFNGNIMCI